MTKFDRYEILENHYSSILKQWNWEAIKKETKNNCRLDEDQIIGSYWLGTVLGVFPSGKIYACWTTNQTKADVVKDECFTNVLEKFADEHGLYLNFHDDSVFLEKGFNLDELENLKFNVQNDYDLAVELFQENI